MSRSNQTELTNPAKRFFDYSGDTGKFSYFDKELKDEQNPKGTKIAVPLPFKFVVLDILSSITGWNDADGCGIYSNEIKDLKTQTLTVRTFKKTDIAQGLYENIKDRCKAEGGGYTASVYIGFYLNGKLEIGHIKFKGASLGSWIEFGKNNSFYKAGITVSSTVEAKKGKTVYQIPQFAFTPITEATDEAAKLLDKELQEYLSKYFERHNQTNIEKQIVSAAEQNQSFPPDDEMPPLTEEEKVYEPTDDLPF